MDIQRRGSKGEVAASDKRESNDRRRQNRNGKRDFNKAKKRGR